MHHDSTLQKINFICDSKCPEIKDKIHSLYLKLIEYTNKNWNVNVNHEFEIELSVHSQEKELSFSYLKEFNKFVWFKQNDNSCSSGFDLEDSSLQKLFKWLG